jgi:hypothetical protein
MDELGTIREKLRAPGREDDEHPGADAGAAIGRVAAVTLEVMGASLQARVKEIVTL